jgi:hypothetical protein
MKIEWKYRYVPNGQIEPDEYGRWAIDGYMFANINKSLPQYYEMKKLLNNVLRIRIATIQQVGTTPGNVPSLIHRFSAECLTFEDAGNFGMGMRYYFANDVDELKLIVEDKLNQAQSVFKYCN